MQKVSHLFPERDLVIKKKKAKGRNRKHPDSISLKQCSSPTVGHKRPNTDYDEQKHITAPGMLDKYKLTRWIYAEGLNGSWI